MDDPVSKLEHMGRETVKKLADLQAAAAQAGVVLAGLESHISRVEKVQLRFAEHAEAGACYGCRVCGSCQQHG